MKKIFLWGYWEKNFGDDLFYKSIFRKNEKNKCHYIYINRKKI